jgi:hypothetical protein
MFKSRGDYSQSLGEGNRRYNDTVVIADLSKPVTFLNLEDGLDPV